jgi:hypothetical protein
VAQRVPGSLGSQITWQWHRIVVRLSALCTGCLYPQDIYLVLISVRGWVDPRAIVQPKGLCHWKIPVTPSGIEPVTCQFVAQWLNHYASTRPLTAIVLQQIISLVGSMGPSDFHLFGVPEEACGWQLIGNTCWHKASCHLLLTDTLH